MTQFHSPREDAAASLARQARNAEHLTRSGLYHPSQEHDACGVGLVAAIDGKPRREVIDRALEALGSIWHRGAVAADGKTGDGAGIHVQVSQDFFRDCVKRTGHSRRAGRTAVGMVFLPRTDYNAQEACRSIVETEILRAGYYIYGWRQVPIDTTVIGERANEARPEIEQILFACENSDDIEPLDRDLYLIRRRIEKRTAARGIKDFYICSLSAHSLIYKGMFLAEQLSVFYPDLADRRFISSFAIYHQRYSTNTVPTWWLAQPFRMLAHNGEINTIRGNTNWMQSHEILMANELFGDRQDDIRPVIGSDLSDSAALDATFEVIVRAGRTAPMAKTMLIPEAWNDKQRPVPPAHRDMYAYVSALTEPWDGPAAIAATDGNWVVAGMDRNGLRPMRYLQTRDDLLIVGSECGLCITDEENVVAKGRIGPGEMIGVDLEHGTLYTDRALKDKLASEQPYETLAANIVALDDEIGPGPEPRLFRAEDLHRRQKAAGLSVEDLELILSPMAEDGKEAVGSMGDDTPLAVLSEAYRPLSHFLRQKFSQVTNPPIDPIREARVMSLRTRFGNLRNVLTDKPFLSEVMTLESPIVLNGPTQRLLDRRAALVAEIDCTFPLTCPDAKAPGMALRKALDRIREEACEAVRNGRSLLVLTDMAGGPDRGAMPMILATSAIHTRLVAEGLRNNAGLIVRAGECMDTHACAMLISCGATAVNPYLAQESLTERHERGLYDGRTHRECLRNFKTALEQGLLKILSKMGISVISSYRAGFNFEAVGLSRALVDEFFPGVSSRISGIGLAGLETKIRTLHAQVVQDPGAALPIGGHYRFRARGEVHALQGPLIHLLQEAVGRDDYRLYKTYSEKLRKLPPVHLRDLVDFRAETATAMPLDAVESVNEIRKRFVTPGMSLGALSPEAHGVLNIAMNRIGAKSDSGEGGEDPDRFVPMSNGDNANSAIKQVASGRFGVTAEYLNKCREIEIKVAQGAKPGEGGQLPGFKVTDLIARFRHATPGVTLISPPPHHDIYSIEDLAQLIYDLKQINPDARICVKLVATSGIGTIASGVAKAKADVILVSGNVGGTGASPQTSIKYAGMPWEMGLSEVNQVLTLHHLRHRVTLRTDGGLRTGRDIVIAALLGAEEYGIGTASLVAMGCIMVRQCHSNTCPVGVCTQDEDLRARFTGTPEKVVNLMSFIAEEVREILADLGVTSLSDIIGRTDLLTQVSRGAPHLDDLDLNPLLVQADPGPNPRVGDGKRNDVPAALDERMVKDAKAFLDHGQKTQLTYTVRNTQRAIGTRISSHIVRRFEGQDLAPDQLTVQLHGSAGQSLGAFAAKGLRLEVLGEANDYVGKGLSGATIIVRPPRNSHLVTQDNTIIGNTVLYGATSGFLFAAGQAGERFAVRNSGATAVIEGCGGNGCEYMTGGVTVILGPVGPNFAAGMTGGMAFILDTDGSFETAVNGESVVWQRIETTYWDALARSLVHAHHHTTQSAHAEEILATWERSVKRIWQVCPKEMLGRLPHPITRAEELRTTG